VLFRVFFVVVVVNSRISNLILEFSILPLLPMCHLYCRTC